MTTTIIKAGQIYEHKYSPMKVCITYVDAYEIRLIRQDGKTYNKFTELDADLWWKLLAEYPTWQEAVNSKEFKGE